MDKSDTLDIASTVTRLQRLSMTLPPRAKNLTKPVGFTKLMEVSVQRLQSMAYSREQEERVVGLRILETAKGFSRWESEHAQLMKKVALQRRAQQQCHQLLSATFQLIHRRSLFEHLRQQHLSGARREQLLRHFFADNYTNGVIAEHGVFLRSSASLACSSYLGTDLLRDAVFQAPLQDYQHMYAAYFSAHCDALLQLNTEHGAPLAQSMVQASKRELDVLRQTIFSLANKISVQDRSYVSSDY